MSSLRRGLTLWLWSAISLVGAVCVVIDVAATQSVSQTQLDYQMQQVAHILAGQTFGSGWPAAGLTDSQVFPSIHISHDQDDDLIVTVRDSGGGLLYASQTNRQLPGGILPALELLGFQTLKIGNGEYRVFAAQSRDLPIQVAESVDVIRET